MNLQDFVKHITEELSNENLGDAEHRNQAVITFLNGVYDGLELSKNETNLINSILNRGGINENH